MDKETIIKKLTHPLVCIIAITVAVGTGVAYGCINHVRNEKQAVVSNADVLVYKEATSDEVKVLRAQDLEQTTTSPIDSESQERMIQTVSEYFAARYNFKGSYSANKERIIEAVKPLLTPDFLISIEKSFTESKKLEGTDREMKDYHCEVLNVYQNGYSESELKSKGIQPSFFVWRRSTAETRCIRSRWSMPTVNIASGVRRCSVRNRRRKSDVGKIDRFFTGSLPRSDGCQSGIAAVCRHGGFLCRERCSGYPNLG